MKRFLLILALPLGLLAQPAALIKTSNGAPTGGCAANWLDVNIVNGNLYTCVASVWTLSGGGSSFNPAIPGTIGGTTPAEGLFSTLNKVCVVGLTGSSNTIASCITALTALQGGTIYIPAGVTVTIPTSINLNDNQSITIEGASNGAVNLNSLGASTILFTGTTGPFITAKSTTGITLRNLVLVWNNAAATGDFFNSGHSGTAIDTSNLEIDHCYIGKIGSGAALTNLLNLNDTIGSAHVHHNWLAGPAAVAILGANTASDYTTLIEVGPGNTFGVAAGSISASMIRNLAAQSSVHHNVFEMSTGAGSPSVMDWNVAVVANGSFTENWVGDAPAGYSGNYFSEGTAILEGFAWERNTLAMSNSATGQIFNFAGTTAYGLSVNENFVAGPTFWKSSTNINGLIMRGNALAGGMGTALNIVSGNVNGLDFTKNGGVAPSTLLTGTPASGCVQNLSWVTTCYGADIRTVASGSTAMVTGALAANTCASATTVGATGVATTDVIAFTPSTDISAAVGYGASGTDGLKVYPYPTANNVNFKVCNGTGTSITVPAMTLNWIVTR